MYLESKEIFSYCPTFLSNKQDQQFLNDAKYSSPKQPYLLAQCHNNQSLSVYETILEPFTFQNLKQSLTMQNIEKKYLPSLTNVTITDQGMFCNIQNYKTYGFNECECNQTACVQTYLSGTCEGNFFLFFKVNCVSKCLLGSTPWNSPSKKQSEKRPVAPEHLGFGVWDFFSFFYPLFF